MSNAPLFILALPCSYLFLHSSYWTLSFRANTAFAGSDQHWQSRILRTFALVQTALVIMILSSNHVQIITRLASGYPLWYWWLASSITSNQNTLFKGSKQSTLLSGAVRWMVIYAIVQGGLFASFLPPA